MTRVLFASRAWESREIEGGFLLLKDIANYLGNKVDKHIQVFFLSQESGVYNNVHLLPSFRKTGWGISQQLDLFFSLLRHLRSVDIVHFAHTPTYINAAVIRTLKMLFPRVFFVQTITGFNHHRSISRLLFWGDKVITISPILNKLLKARFGIEADYISPAPRPDRIEGKQKTPSNLTKRLKNSRVVVFPIDVFRLDPSKFDIKKVVTNVLSSHPNVLCIFLDRFGEETKIRDLLAQKSKKRVIFLPIIDYLPDILRRADVVAYPMSDTSGKFNPPMVLFEANYFHCKVVCAESLDMTGTSETIQIDNFHWESWSSGISNCLNSNAQFQQSVTRTLFYTNCEQYIRIYTAD